MKQKQKIGKKAISVAWNTMIGFILAFIALIVLIIIVVASSQVGGDYLGILGGLFS